MAHVYPSVPTRFLVHHDRGRSHRRFADAAAKHANLVVITGHDPERLKLAEETIKKQVPSADIQSLILDLSLFSAVRKAAAEVNACPESIHLGRPDPESYQIMDAYSRTKSTNILTAIEVSKRSKGHINAYSLYPETIYSNGMKNEETRVEAQKIGTVALDNCG
ncbi:hypothetical protein B0H19DRAFT_1058828 [Mycena capillaripes]|nr:hypothetical protein B0H19DRAFT_1058828 [Mycena capillaripes]